MKLCLIIIGLITCLTAVQSNPIVERVIGGVDATAGQLPYQALIRIFFENGGWSWCGGILIHSSWILTAAHCVIDPQPVYFEVVLGSVYFDITIDDPNRLIVTAANRIYHDLYAEFLPIYDIALIGFPHDIEFTDYIQPVALPKDNSDLFFNVEVIASGWGYVEHGSGVAPAILQYAPQIVMPNSECSNWFYFAFVPEASIVCAMGPNAEGICHGDSGGPLVDPTTNTLVGITNFRHDVACGYGPGGFARVSAYLDWISENTGGVV